MIDIFLGPKQYIQRAGIIKEAAEYLAAFGRRPLILADDLVMAFIRPELEPQMTKAGLVPIFTRFGEECSQKEVLRLMDIARQEKADLMVGTGGGKAIDTARVVAEKLKLPLITMPTSAATCSAASAVAVLYEKGVRQATVNGKGAELVLVDSAIISRAPVRLLASGMGDALAKWYEGKPSYERTSPNDAPTQAAMNLATQVKETIFTLGLPAKESVAQKQNTAAVERIIENNILLTGLIGGLGGSKFRIAVAHALLYGLTILPQVHQNLHGEMVAFGVVMQLCLEKNEEELQKILPFFAQLGLPLTLQELGLTNLEDPLFWEGLKRICAPGSSAHNMPFPLNEEKLFQAMLEADERGKAWR